MTKVPPLGSSVGGAGDQAGLRTGSITDINLGQGSSFVVAEPVRKANTPFTFLTGYDESLIPQDFANVPRSIKPIDTRRIVRELSRCLEMSRA